LSTTSLLGCPCQTLIGNAIYYLNCDVLYPIAVRLKTFPIRMNQIAKEKNRKNKEEKKNENRTT
jgi:hypothetical protein